MPKLEKECKHTFEEHMIFKEARASSEIEGAHSDKTDCELMDIAEEAKPESWEGQLDYILKNVKIHHSGLPCFNDSLRVYAIKRLISRAIQDERERLIKDIKHMKLEEAISYILYFQKNK